MSRVINIAIDGPSGAGKSTIASMVAKEFGCIHIDTGAMYRGIAYYMLSIGVDPKDTETVVSSLGTCDLNVSLENGIQKVIVNGSDVTGFIRQNEVSLAASAVSAIPEVRQYLLDVQRNIAKTNSVVMDGRDIGSVILPDADVKIYLTASAEKRADRRYKELCEKGQNVDYEQILKEIVERDYNDSHRAISPLIQTEDAILLDTSDIGIQESFEAAKNIVLGKIQ